MRSPAITLGPLAPLLTWTLLWWALGKPQMVFAGVIFGLFLIPIGFLRARFDGNDETTLRTLITATGLVLGLCCAVLAGTWGAETPPGNPLAGEVDPLSYDRFEVVGEIVAWDALPVESPIEDDEWEPLLVTVADSDSSFEFICDGRELRGRLEKGGTLRAGGQLSGRDLVGTTPIATWVEVLD